MVDKVTSYELGTGETSVAVNGTKLFNASVDDMLSRMGKVCCLNANGTNNSWNYYVYHYLRG